MWPLRSWDEFFLQNYLKVILIHIPPKPFNFHSLNPSCRKPSDYKRNQRITTAQIDTDGKRGLFIHEQLAHLHTGNTQKKVSNIASDEDIMENNYMYAMFWNLNVISHWTFSFFFFFLISGAKSKNNLRGYVPFKGKLSKIFFFFLISL